MRSGVERSRRDKWRRLRRLGVLVGATMIAIAVLGILGTSVSSNGTQEWINGRGDTSSIILPLALFALGGLLLAACLPG